MGRALAPSASFARDIVTIASMQLGEDDEATVRLYRKRVLSSVRPFSLSAAISGISLDGLIVSRSLACRQPNCFACEKSRRDSGNQRERSPLSAIIKPEERDARR